LSIISEETDASGVCFLSTLFFSFFLQLFWLKTCSMSNMCQCSTLTRWLLSMLCLVSVSTSLLAVPCKYSSVFIICLLVCR
jgi:hypothetical protein